MEKNTNLKLSKEAQEVIDICEKEDITPWKLVEANHPLKNFIDEVITSSDDFWYGITNGYINYTSVLASEKDVKKVEDAIEILEELAEIVRRVGIEF